MTRLIDADALITAVLKKAFDDAFLNGNTDMHRLLIQVIAHQPTIDAEPVRHGKWITEECLPGVAVCSICGHEIRGIGCQYTKYCDECGARMDKDD